MKPDVKKRNKENKVVQMIRDLQRDLPHYLDRKPSELVETENEIWDQLEDIKLELEKGEGSEN